MEKNKIKLKNSLPEVGLTHALECLVHQLKSYKIFDPNSIEKLAAALGEDLGRTNNKQLLRLKAISDRQQNKVLKTLKYIHEALRENPFDLTLQSDRRVALNAAVNRFNELYYQDPESDELGAIFEVLYREGWMNLTTQIKGIVHFVSVKNYKRAYDLAMPMNELCPNFMGLSEVLVTLMEQLPAKNIKLMNYDQKPEPRLKLEAGKITYGEMAQFIEWNLLLSSDLGTKSQESLTQMIDTLDKELNVSAGVIDPNIKDLWFYYGILLDHLGRYVDAFEIFYALSTYFPEEAEFRSSYKIQIDRLDGWINLLASMPDQRGAFLYGYELVCNHHFVFLSNFILRLEMHIADGEITLAKELGNKLLKVNPHDHDYLLGIQGLAKKLGDERWVVEIQEMMERERKSRPWEIALFTGES